MSSVSGLRRTAGLGSLSAVLTVVSVSVDIKRIQMSQFRARKSFTAYLCLSDGATGQEDVEEGDFDGALAWLAICGRLSVARHFGCVD